MKNVIRLAAACAAIAVAGPALAAPVPYNPLHRTYALRCVAEARQSTDPAERGIGEFVITNTAPRTIPKGTQIRISYLTQGGSRGTFAFNMYRDLAPGQKVEFNQQYRNNRCLAAVVTLPPARDAATDMVKIKPSPVAKSRLIAR
jgi:hypothetical protein